MPQPEQATYPRLAEETMPDTAAAYNQLQSLYAGFINTLFFQERISSIDEVRQLQTWLESIRDDAPAIQEALQNFSKYAVPTMQRELQKKSGAVSALLIAKQGDVISKDSYEQWMTWLEDVSLTSEAKMQSMEGKVKDPEDSLPDYLARRRTLAVRREGLIGSAQFATLKESLNPAVRRQAETLEHTDTFLNELTIDKREALVVDLLNALPVLASEKTLFATFEKELDAAVGKYISEDSRARWIARFKDPTVDPADRKQFVEKKFPAYVARWKAVHEKRDTLKKDPLLSKLTKSDIADIEMFAKDGAFLALCYDAKVDLVQRVDNAITAVRNGQEAWTRNVTAVVTSAAEAGYVSKNRVGELVANMREARRSVQEVKDFVKEWAKVRYRYDQVEKQMLHGKVPQGFRRVPVEEFLMMKLPQRLSYLSEAENRLLMESRLEANITLPKNLLFMIRHELDSENWDLARKFLDEAWTKAESEQDIEQLKSMENYLSTFGKESGQQPEQEKLQAVRAAVQKIDAAYAQLPEQVQPFYTEAFKAGNAGCVRCLGVLLYNVWWCILRGYLPRDLRQAKDRAQFETAQRLEPAGPSHTDGAIEYNDIETYGNSAIREQQWGPNVMCVGSSDASRIAKSTNTNQNDFGYWYWGDLIVDGVSSGQYERLGLVTRKAITSGMYALEALGETYHSAKEKLGMAELGAAA